MTTIDFLDRNSVLWLCSADIMAKSHADARDDVELIVHDGIVRLVWVR